MRIRTLPVGRPAKTQKGYTYIFLLAAVVIVGILAEVGTLLNSRVAKADKEAELLFRGLAYRAAIESYYSAGKTVKSYPPNFDDLLSDPRFLEKHHIRKLYSDPMTETEWTILRATDGGIIGIRSGSNELSLKRNNFPQGITIVGSAEKYSEWLFHYVPELIKKSPPAKKLPSDKGPSDKQL